MLALVVVPCLVLIGGLIAASSYSDYIKAQAKLQCMDANRHRTALEASALCK